MISFCLLGIRMSHAQEIVKILRKDRASCCDDCLSKHLVISPRQQVNAICRNLEQKGAIRRQQGTCIACGKSKIVNTTLITPTNSGGTPKRDTDVYSASEGITPKEFEERVNRYLTRTYGVLFSEKTLDIGGGKAHRFDLVSEDGSIIVECKSYNWTKSGNYPSAKITTLKEAIFYFSLVSAARKILVMHRRPFPGKEPLVDVFYRRNRSLLGDVELWDYSVGVTPEEDSIRVVHPLQIDEEGRK